MKGSEEVARHFARNLRSARLRAGISQEELGSRAGLHRTEIGLLERGGRVPRTDTVIKLASGLGLRIECPLFEGMTWNSGTTTQRPGAFVFPSLPDEEGRADA